MPDHGARAAVHDPAVPVAVRPAVSDPGRPGMHHHRAAVHNPGQPAVHHQLRAAVPGYHREPASLLTTRKVAAPLAGGAASPAADLPKGGRSPAKPI